IQYSYNINIDQVTNAAVSPLKAVTNKQIADLDNNLKTGHKEYSDVFENWKRIQLMSKYSELNEYVNTSVAKVNSNIQKLPFQNQPLVLQSDNSILPIPTPVELYNKFHPDLLLPSAVVLLTHAF